MNILRRVAVAFALTATIATATLAQTNTAAPPIPEVSDAALVKSLPGFEEGTVVANGGR
ncbi:hypothetical protein MicloDRAFT_00051990 [Microvirga lotononidis]|uniref:Uncharacterized protein n=1 Tax=Microvirga lotononidis TaxID=864069 RepID=I4YKJ5_9HYPH|nr:hypothetical protein MicloDRAFT_00051990 [Microvirga lotononidis]